MYLVFVYVPKDYVEKVKTAMFEAGAGRIGNYSCCSWQVEGEGQFRAEKGSDPFLGKIGEIEKVSEYKVDMVCSDEYLTKVIAVMKKTHPYEMPAYGVIKLENILI